MCDLYEIMYRDHSEIMKGANSKLHLTPPHPLRD